MEPILVPVAGSQQMALVSPEDEGLVFAYRWHIDARRDPTGRTRPRRIRTNGRLPNGRRMFALHQLVMGFPPGLIDHINGDVFDNRRENLRLANKSGNRANAKPNGDRRFKGVTRNRHRWEACLFRDGKRRYLGLFPTEEAAALAYDAAAKEHFGEFARLNFPERLTT